MSCLGIFHPTTVLLPERVANPMQSVLDSPMAPPDFEKLRGIRFATREAGDGVLDFRGPLTLSLGCSFQTNNLL